MKSKNNLHLYICNVVLKRAIRRYLILKIYVYSFSYNEPLLNKH